MKAENRVAFETAMEAEAAGYRKAGDWGVIAPVPRFSAKIARSSAPKGPSVPITTGPEA